MTWFFNALGIALIIFIIWWFWFPKSRNKMMIPKNNVIDIVVANGSYTPALIQLQTGKDYQLRFIRKDPSPCAEWVIFPKLNINDQLPVNKPHGIHIKIDDPNDYEFTCQMGMYRGKLTVVKSE